MKIEIEKTDRELHQRFIQLGNDRRKLTNELLAILPEIFERKIYKKYAATIEEYAGKFGGLSKGVVKKRLRLEKYLENKPLLRDAIKTEGIHKVALVASLATSETEVAWVDKLKNMSKPAIQELAKEVRYKMEKNQDQSLFENFEQSAQNQRLFENSNQIENHCFAAPQHVKINLEGELYFMFLKLKKKYGENLSNQEVMKKIFEENLNKNQQMKIAKTGGVSKNSGNKTKVEIHKNPLPQSVKVVPGDNFSDKKTASRYISAPLRKSALQKTDGRCTYPSCNRPAQAFHHRNRFANSKFTENPHESIVPVCKIHHEFTHNGIIKNERLEISEWQLDLQPEVLDKIDKLYRQYARWH